MGIRRIKLVPLKWSRDRKKRGPKNEVQMKHFTFEMLRKTYEH